MRSEWYEIPVLVERNKKELVVPANQVQKGDKVWFAWSGVSHIAAGHIVDDEEEIVYIEINNGADCWPAEMFLSEIKNARKKEAS